MSIDAMMDYMQYIKLIFLGQYSLIEHSFCIVMYSIFCNSVPERYIAN